jgi:hypothetical protein
MATVAGKRQEQPWFLSLLCAENHELTLLQTIGITQWWTQVL